MHWFALAIFSPILFAITNHIDKALLSRYFQENGVGVLLIFSAIASAIALPVLFAFESNVFVAEPIQQFALGVAALLNICLLWLYLTALDDADASIVIVFYQLVPVIGAFLGFAFLGETLTAEQIGAMAVVIIGASIASVDLNGSTRALFRMKTVSCMVGASFCWAASATIFKVVALEVDVIPALFWEHVALTIAGIAIFAFSAKFRTSFLSSFKGSSTAVVSLNLLNEALYILGNVAAAFAYMMVPISLVLLTEAFQPLVVFLLALLILIIAPSWTTERFTKIEFLQKTVAILVTGGGTYWLLTTTG
jgi:drug/metabolite transporter (DMT)-like permease